MMVNWPPFFRTIRWKLIAGTLLAIVVPLVVFAAVSSQILWRFYTDELERQLVVHAHIIGDSAAWILAPNTPNDPVALSHLVERWRKYSNIRLTLCDGDGIIQAAPDSSVVNHHVTDVQDPGMLDAVHGHPNSTVWKSPNFEYEDTMYVNLPVYEKGRLVGAVRVAYSLLQIRQMVGRIESALVFTIGAYAFLVVCGSLALGTTLVRPLERLTEQAHGLGGGDLTTELSVKGTVEIENLVDTLNNMRERLQHLEELRRRHVSDLSHEFRTPLATIRAMAETILRHGKADPQVHLRYLEGIISQTDRLAEFARQVLDLAQIESGHMAFQWGDVNVAEVIAEAVQTVSGAASEQGVELTTSVASSLVSVCGDHARLHQVLTNLLANAIRHTPPGGRVEVTARADHDRALLQVRDTGEGISSEHLPFIFERFYRVDKSRSGKSGGTGLGLCMVREIVQAHGGTVEVTSELGCGSTFTVGLPGEGSKRAPVEEKERHPVLSR